MRELHQVGTFDGGHHGRDGALRVSHHVPAGLAAAVVGQGPQHNAGVSREVRFQRFGHAVETVPPQEQGVVAQGHAMLLRPRCGAKTASPVDENYALLEHVLSLWHGPVIGADDILTAGILSEAPRLPLLAPAEELVEALGQGSTGTGRTRRPAGRRLRRWARPWPGGTPCLRVLEFLCGLGRVAGAGLLLRRALGTLAGCAATHSGIPGIPGIPPPAAIFFIIFCAWQNVPAGR